VKKKSPSQASSLGDVLREEHIDDPAATRVEKELIAWQLQQAMKKKRISKKRMAELMKTSHSQIDKLLNPKDGNVTIKTLHKAAAVVGKRFEYRLVRRGQPAARRRPGSDRGAEPESDIYKTG
jgi:transcriptional regulator with XRE-family HTH domain